MLLQGEIASNWMFEDCELETLKGRSTVAMFMGQFGCLCTLVDEACAVFLEVDSHRTKPIEGGVPKLRGKRPPWQEQGVLGSGIEETRTSIRPYGAHSD